MELTIIKNQILSNPDTQSFLADSYFPSEVKNLGLVVFAHGYKGYKDWGAWDLMARTIASAGFYVVTFNFSHNGTTLEEPSRFADLEAFGHNNYSKELSDLNWVINHFIKQAEVDSQKLFLMAHSRGNGAIAIHASEDQRVKGLVSLGGVSDYASRFPPESVLETIKKEGVVYIENQRTHQQMPHYYQFFEDFKANEDRFSIEKAVRSIDIPYLIIQGADDQTVKVEEAESLQLWSKRSELIIIEEANHGFGSLEPWLEKTMPEDLALATEEIIEFLMQLEQDEAYLDY